ncbi:MAG: hypothetical protein QXO98_04710 [Sulfolobales archaeon]
MTLVVTTSRRPSRKTRSFVKDLTSVIEGLIKVNRGKKTFNELLNIMHIYDSQGILMILEKKGNPSALGYYIENNGKLFRTILIKLCSVKLIREIKGAQRPFNPCRPIIDDLSIKGEVSSDIVASVKTILRLDNKVDSSSLDNLVRLKFIKVEDYVSLTFECIGNEKICGPELRILKVIRNEP